MSRKPLPPQAGADEPRRSRDAAEAETEAAAPSEVAREALRRLAMQRVAPTPDNYRTYYHEIAGTVAEEPFPERALKAIAGALPRTTPEALQLAQRFERAVASGNWGAVRQAAVAMCEAGASAQPWAPLIRELCGHMECGHCPGDAPKRDALHQLLNGAAASPPDQVYLRLQRLLRRWEAEAVEAPACPTAGPGAAARADGPLRALLARLIEHGIAPLLTEHEALAAEARDLAASLAAETGGEPAELAAQRLGAFLDRLGLAAGDQRAIRESLLGLLRLVIDNVKELVIEDGWLRGQLGLLVDTLAGPLDLRVLEDVERRLRDVIDKQRRIKAKLNEAQDRLKHMLAGFVDQLALFSSATGAYHDHLERSAGRIEAAHSIDELSDLVSELLSETRKAQESARRSGEEVAALRGQVDAANRHIARLQLELDHTSELVRHDPLTGALNRKGLDEALAREIERARRRAARLCVALLDVDNFKQINDTHGHKTGDDALRYLVRVVRETLRAQDAVGRFGGEEFLIVLPDTDTEEAVAILTRLQRELTRRFFLADDQRLLITFSAGVAMLGPDEEPESAVERADKAMYAAKQAGKNRVLAAP